MAQTTTTFVINGQLLELWSTAQKHFFDSFPAADRAVKENAEYEPNPEDWLKTFQDERYNKSKKFFTACSKVGPHLHTIQTFLRVAGFSVSVASTAAPAASPASLVVNAFVWLFASFAKVSDDFDKIEAFFELISRKFESLSIINEHLSRQEASDALQNCIVQLFICCLRICALASEQAKDRIKKWLRQLNGNDKLDDELKKLAEVENELRSCIGLKILKASFDAYETGRRVEYQVNELVDIGNRSEQNDILDWLSPFDFSRVYRELQERVSKNGVAGRWLLKSRLFEKWRDEDINRLWYTGKPGAGKSVLTSIIINHLKENVQKSSSDPSNVLVAYLYLSYKSKPEMTELLGSILRQFQVRNEIHHQLWDIFRKYQQAGRSDGKIQRPSTDEIKQLLSQFTVNKRVFIIIDAMDECEYNSREPLLKHLQEIKSDSKILVTSRDLNHLNRLQKGFQSTLIEAHDEDMDEYIQSEIKRYPNLDSVPKLHDYIKSQVKLKSGKMFLIVRLHMDALADVELEAEIEEVLEKLPDTIAGSYENTMNRIRNRPEPRRDRAKSTLGWVAYAQRPLSLQELQHALAISQHSRSVEDKHLRQESEIISDCCGLLVKDLDNMVRYVHYSAQDYFNNTKQEEFPNFDKEITIACVKYLTMSKIHSFISNSKRLKELPFTKYAAQYLHWHHRRIQNLQNDEDVLEVIRTLVMSEPSRILYSQLIFRLKVYDTGSIVLDGVKSHRNLKRHQTKSLQPLHAAVFLGHSELVNSLIEDGEDVNALDPYTQSALIIAIQNGLDLVASVLITHGARVDLSIKKGHFILLYAMERDYSAMIRQVIGNPAGDPLDEGFLKILATLLLLLFETLVIFMTQISLQARQIEPQTNTVPLLNASAGEELAFHQSLEKYRRFLHLAYTPNVDGLLLLLESPTADPISLQAVPVEDESTQSIFSSSSDYMEDFETETDNDSNSDESKSEISSEIRSVSSFDVSVESSVRDLDTEGSNAEDTNDLKLDGKECQTISDLSFIGELDDHETNPSDQTSNEESQNHLMYHVDADDYDDSRLHETSEEAYQAELTYFDDDVVETMVESVSVDITKTILATESKREILSQTGDITSKIDIIRKTFLRTACFVAVERGNHEIVDVLLRFGISPDLRNFHGQPLLSRATARNDYKMVKLLLGRGATVDQRDLNGRTALMANADMKKKKVLELLIAHGADINLTQREGCHELYEAAVFGATEVVEFFLEKGADPSVTNHFGWTPLHGAAANGHLECVRLLLEKGASPSPISDTGKTPRDFVHDGKKHYDYILTGKEHYKTQIHKTKELSLEVQQWRRDEIMHLLDMKGGLTSDDLYMKIGEKEFLHEKNNHPGWSEDSWWDKRRR